MTQNLVSDLTEDLVSLGLDVHLREVPRYEEATALGADIILWLQNPDGRLAGIHLQAKRQYPDDTYKDLDHKNKTAGAQYRLLVDGAAINGALAAYAFYNGLDDHQPTSTSCFNNILDPNAHGVSVAQAERIERSGNIKGRVARADIEELCAPLGCLIRCGLRRHGIAGPADALLNFGPALYGDRELVSPDNAPSYLTPLLLEGTHQAYRSRYFDEPTSDADVARQLVDDLDEGGAFVTVLLARAVQDRE